MNVFIIIAIIAIIIMGALSYALTTDTLKRYERVREENEKLEQERISVFERLERMKSSLEDAKASVKWLDEQHRADMEKMLALDEENVSLNEAYRQIMSRIVTISREVPEELVSSKKAERLMVKLREHMQDDGGVVSVQIVTRPAQEQTVDAATAE